MCFGLAKGAQAESGFLFGPWTPVYGTASVLIIIISEKMFKILHMHRFIETIIVLINLTILLTGLELLGGTLIEFLLGYSYWDYTEHEFNIVNIYVWNFL